ncbi:MAG: hypothetical protein IPK99_10975 [Flavobacteriales bacterium]|nr:hypothetical protein [Flavobacteriales bacterium]
MPITLPTRALHLISYSALFFACGQQPSTEAGVERADSTSTAEQPTSCHPPLPELEVAVAEYKLFLGDSLVPQEAKIARSKAWVFKIDEMGAQLKAMGPTNMSPYCWTRYNELMALVGEPWEAPAP